MRRRVEVLSIRIPRRVALRLAQAARRSGRTKAEIVLEAVERQLDREGEASGSFLDGARDLVGCVGGAKNLSSNKKHLERSGRS